MNRQSGARAVLSAVAFLLVGLALLLPSCKEERSDPPLPSGPEVAGVITLPPLAALWSEPLFLASSPGQVIALVADSDQPIYIDGLRSANAIYYEFIGPRPVALGPYYRYFEGVWNSRNKAATLIVPPVHTAYDYFPPSLYRVKLVNTTGDQATVTLKVDTKQDSDFQAGQLDLNFFIYTSGEPNSLIPDEAAAQRGARLIEEIMAPAGVTLGQVTASFIDDPEIVAQALDEREFHNLLINLSLQSKGEAKRGINCFVFPRLAGSILGIDGAIPGPGGLSGVRSSGLMAVAVPISHAAHGYDEEETSFRLFAKIVAHEIGHYLGLFHTTEQSGYHAGPVTDIPVCPMKRDANNDGVLTGEECRQAGAEYLMFWSVDGGLLLQGEFQTRISPQEKKIIQTHPAVK